MSRVVIPVIIIDGQIKLWDGSDLPKLKDCATADIVLSSSAFVDKKRVEDYLEETKETLLNAGTEILIAVRPYYVPAELICYTVNGKNILNCRKYDFVPVLLVDDLEIMIQGFKKGKLEKCKCVIPAFKNHPLYSSDAEQDSLNSAYTVISKYFEPKRKSYGGNVFLNSFIKQRGQWILLEEKRNPLAKFSYAGDYKYED